ncbi:aminopeptidase N-like [Polyergus mexicanus]|uniref:aminopeptidase N-like n=1 Tax=Polyergus mexicanus TaxID=615972 RepID=UPI0038B49F4F
MRPEKASRNDKIRKNIIGMAFLKLLLSIDIIIAAMALPDQNWTAEIQTAVNYHLPNNVKPIHYNIELILPIKGDIFRGESNVSIEIYAETQYIELHSANLVITKTTLINKNIQKSKNNAEKSVYKPIEFSYVHKTNTYIMYFIDEILPGNYTLNINFLGKATNNTEGLFRTSYKNKEGKKISMPTIIAILLFKARFLLFNRWLFATYLQTTGARYLFPCWDEPNLRAQFTISVKHPQEYRALSNMPIENERSAENNMIWTHFITTPPMPSYFVTIAIIGYTSDFIANEIDRDIVFKQLNITIWFREQIKYKTHTYELFQKYILYLEKYWNVLNSKVIRKIDYVAIPNFPEKAIATWGLVLYREADIFYESRELKSQVNKQSLIIYNILYESLSDMPSWLKEGLANIVAADVIDKIASYIRKIEWFVVQNQHESLCLNFYFNRNLSQISKPLDINSLPSFFRYNKAFSILRMLQHLITHEAFLLGTKIYLQNRNSLSETSSEVFWESMQSALNIMDNKNEINLIEKMDGWTKHTSYPILKITHNFADHIDIILENSDSIDSDLWIPITHTVQTNPDFNKTSFYDVEWLKFTKDLPKKGVHVSKRYKKNDWFIINLQQVGYYRVNYDTENWKRIAKYLNSKEYIKIHVLNRAQIIDDAYHFLTTRQINSSVFWDITNYLSRETDFIAWYPMIKAFEHMSSVLPLSDKRVYNIKEKMQKILNELLQNIKYEELDTSDYLNCLRQEARKWACIFGESNCKIVAGLKLQEHLTNRTTNNLLPWWKEWTYCNGLAMSGNNIWDNVFNIYKNKTDNRYLKFLACSENIAIIQKYTTLIALKDCNRITKDKDRVNSFHFIITKHAKNSLMLDYIFAYFERIVPRQVTIATLIDIINHMYSMEQLNKISGAKISMALLKLLSSLGIIIVVTAFSINENEKKNLATAINHRLPNDIIPIHYNIELILNIEEGIYRGKSNINIKISKETRSITLHSMNLAIIETTLINEDVRQSKNEKFIYKSTEYSYIQEINIVIIHFNNKLLPGNYTLNIEFFVETIDNIEGLFRTSYTNEKGDKVWLIATHLEAIGARQLFPCWDKPELKASFTISVKHPIKYKALSNMPVRKKIVGSNMAWTYFSTTPIMSPNLVTIVVMDFVSTSDNSKVKIWHREGISHAFYMYIVTNLIKTILENEWCTMTLKMIPKVDYVAIPDFPEKAVVTWGLVLYSHTDIVLENTDSFDDLWVPITYTTQSDLNFNKTSFHHIKWQKFTPQESYVEIPENYKKDGWIIFNLQQAGYYRVDYDIENWKRIATYLNSMEYSKIHVLNRAQIIDDAYYFLTVKQFDSSVFWQLTKYLSQETDYVAWYPMIKALEDMSKVFPISDRRVYNIKKEMKEILNKLLRNMGYEESDKNYFTNCLKQEVTKWACILDEPNCKTVASLKLQQHLANRATNKLLPWWEEWTYCNGLMTNDNIWNDVFEMYIKESDNKYLKFLACSGNIAIIQNYTLLMASKDHDIIIKDKDHINSFHFIIAKHAKNGIMLSYILSNFEKIIPRQANPIAILIDLINHVYTREELNKEVR